MNKTEVKLHLDNIIGEDSQNLSDIGFMIAVCKVYKEIRPIIVFIRPFLKLKRAWKLGSSAFLMLFDSRCKVNTDD